MQHHNRWDLPKGHVDRGETDLECALRELDEETGIKATDIELDDTFWFESHYPVRDRRFPNHVCDKTLRIILGWIRHEVEIRPTEHIGYRWFTWDPPHAIQAATIDPLLAQLESFLANKST